MGIAAGYAECYVCINKPFMKKVFLLFALSVALSPSGNQLYAQSSTVTQDDTKASLEISKNIIKLIGSLAKDFADIKGEQITKTEDGTVVYKVKDMDMMKA